MPECAVSSWSVLIYYFARQSRLLLLIKWPLPSFVDRFWFVSILKQVSNYWIELNQPSSSKQGNLFRPQGGTSRYSAQYLRSEVSLFLLFVLGRTTWRWILTLNTKKSPNGSECHVRIGMLEQHQTNLSRTRYVMKNQSPQARRWYPSRTRLLRKVRNVYPSILLDLIGLL